MGREEFGSRIGGFGRAEEQEFPGAQRIVEQREQLALQLAFQIDQQVAACDHAYVKERGILHRAVMGEQHEVAHILADAVMFQLAHEEALEPFFGHICLDRPRVPSLARGRQRPLVEIAGEDLDIRVGPAPLGFLEQQDRDRVGFFAGGAADRPDADRLVLCVRVHQCGDHRFGKL